MHRAIQPGDRFPAGNPLHNVTGLIFYPLPDPIACRFLKRDLLSAHAVHAGALQAGVYARPGQGRGSTRGAPAILNVLSSERGEDVGIDAPKRYSFRKCMMKRSPQMMGTLWCGAPPECASRAGGCGFDTRWWPKEWLHGLDLPAPQLPKTML